MSSSYSVLKPDEMQVLADFLGESPETVLSIHALRRQEGQALVVGEFLGIQAAIIQRMEFPSEPTAFGTDARAIWILLQAVEGLDCVNADWEVAKPLGRLIQEEVQIPVRFYGDFYYTLSGPVAHFHHDWVRRLGVEDHDLLVSAPKEFHGH